MKAIITCPVCHEVADVPNAECLICRKCMTENDLAWTAGEVEADHEPEVREYDPGPEIDDEGGMSEYRHADRDEGEERRDGT